MNPKAGGHQSGTTDFSIDQLMLKTDETSQKAFVNGGLRFKPQTFTDTSVTAKTERQRFYKELYQKRINDLKKHTVTTDFSIKPVPR